MTEREIFMTALQKESLTERQAYLEAACAGQPEMREQVETLLRLHENAGSFLENPALKAATGEFPSPTNAGAARDAEGPGMIVGPYKLLQKIGEGGMGDVWMAEQTRPVQRKVALKLIKPGMDNRLVIARFGRTVNFPLDADGVSRLVRDVIAATAGEKDKLANTN